MAAAAATPLCPVSLSINPSPSVSVSCPCCPVSMSAPSSSLAQATAAAAMAATTPLCPVSLPINPSPSVSLSCPLCPVSLSALSPSLALTRPRSDLAQQRRLHVCPVFLSHSSYGGGGDGGDDASMPRLPPNKLYSISVPVLPSLPRLPVCRVSLSRSHSPSLSLAVAQIWRNKGVSAYVQSVCLSLTGTSVSRSVSLFPIPVSLTLSWPLSDLARPRRLDPKSRPPFRGLSLSLSF